MTVGFHAQHTKCARPAIDCFTRRICIVRVKLTGSVCTGITDVGGNCSASYRGDMSEFLETHSGWPRKDIVTEIESQNTHQHAD